MHISSATFHCSAPDLDSCPDESLPEFAFIGRSNVGKSRLINSLLGVQGLARTSSTPGRTRAVNFFLINQQFRFVDLPGYGYARAPKAIKKEWGAAAEEYLAKREQLVLSIHLVDSRHEPTKQDLQLHEWLAHHQKPHLIVATKSDKLSNNELRKNVNRIRGAFGNDCVVAYSAITGSGRKDLWKEIEKALSQSRPL